MWSSFNAPQVRESDIAVWEDYQRGPDPGKWEVGIAGPKFKVRLLSPAAGNFILSGVR